MTEFIEEAGASLAGEIKDSADFDWSMNGSVRRRRSLRISGRRPRCCMKSWAGLCSRLKAIA